MPPEKKRFDGRLAVPIDEIFGEVPELQPIRMVTPNMTWDRPRARIKLQCKVQCIIFISITINWRSLAVLDSSCKIFSEQCFQSLDVMISSWDPFRGIISHREDAGVLIRFNVSWLVEAKIHTYLAVNRRMRRIINLSGSTLN